ncbi:RING finger protein nhl-1 isoform X1 [Daktulosphaira vitifoliae]|uniref:RING finger protein nhl-1 isoform X1 n=1 Tax=Daktulosphaira vitifoliae TaxID=58002 RepID=UPI0021A9C5FC|nr:RING finger protein nhl-1 isoform X1 [Daktulosphaira vitifoliae]XP_050539542.1 RING finger protein nhl-1 isoform X1 [Daktulosphaira vitifoliae]
MEQFEQLLTCAICLDRYRNPKLLPCQHSFCMEPCMDGLVDYVRRQVKCPECRAEHRIPYNGVQGYPTNVTLQRFLELHIEITGELPDPTSGQVMKRCGVCSEKAYVTPCVHCDKEVCVDCKGAHMDILRREISRINNQVRRAVHRLSDMLAGVEKNMLTLQLNCTSVSEEVDEIYSRLTKALKDRTENIRGDIDRYLTTELKNLSNLKDNLEIEISNIQSNCDLADKHMQSDDVEWEDSELMDAKEIFLKTVEFIRNFETEIGDYNRRAKFIMAHDPNQLVMHVAGYGDLVIQAPHQPFTSSSNTLQPPGPGLMRSKSDHRLASQYRQEERNTYDAGGEISGRVSPLGGRKFGERYPSRYSRGDRNEYDADSSHDNENRSSARSRIRSRLNRHGLGDNTDSDTDTRSVRFSEPSIVHRERERVLDTEDVAKGPLSGITRLYDSPRVMKRLQESENKEKKEVVIPKTIVQVQQQVHQFKKPSPQQTPQRQLSEDDEIARIKRQNKTASTSSDNDRKDRVSVIKREESRDSNRSNTPTDNSRKSAVAENADTVESSESESEEEVVETRKSTSVSKPGFPPTSSSSTGSRRSSMTSGNNQKIKSTRSESMESSGSSETPGTTPRKISGTSYPSDEIKQSPVGSRSGSATPRARFSSISSKRDSSTPTNSRSQSYNTSGNNEGSSRKEEIEDEEEDEDTDTSSESSETESDEDSEDSKPKTPTTKAMEKTDIGPLLARSANARDNNNGGSGNNSRRPSQDESYTRSRYGTGGYKSSSSSYQSPKEPDTTTSGSKYLNRTTPRFTSRFLKNKSIEEDPSKSSYSSESKYNDKGLLRSRTSTNLDEDLYQDDPGTSPYSSSYSKNHYGSDLSRSRSSHALKSRENSPDRPVTNSGAAEKDGTSLSSWARYLKNKYGNRNKENSAKENTSSSSAVASSSTPSSSSAARRISLGVGSRSNSTVVDSSDDDQKNMQSSPVSRTIIEPGMQGVGSTPRVQYLQKRQLLFKIGGRGSEPGYFTWPRGVAVGPDNLIVVADSSNHRVQVFDSRGSLYKDFGSYGNSEGEFDCLAGLAVNRIGQYIIADRYNHRIQVLDPSGRFLRSFGSQGSSDGRFNYPWGITTDALGFIYVCDKENHRIQVFQSDGTFVGKFGSQGNKIGQLEHPHYIAVSNTNRVIVSDCNNHRIQIFDVNGRVISSFGSEGSENGQFKFPKGVAVDDQGYILVADSGNNRVQIFHPDSTFLRAFGCWGSGDGEFKGLEGVAVMSNGNILVCDRENHRVQVF